jgi:mono/diheme cytochrome c family protein
MKVLKWLARIVGGLVLLLAVAVGFLVWRSGSRLERKFAPAVGVVAIPTDPTTLAEGRRLATVYCAQCHQEDFGGGKLVEMPLATIDAANLTPGRGSATAGHTDEDWIRTVRYGVRKDGRSVAIMPSGSHWRLSDADLGAIVGYLKTVPAVDREVRPRTFTLLGKILVGAGLFDKDIAALGIDPAAPRPAAPEKVASPAFGEYLVTSYGCWHCHGPELSGQQPPDPKAPFAPNLTQGGALEQWNEEIFLQMSRTRPGNDMPWLSLRTMTDDELRSIWRYLGSLPPKATPVQKS